MIADLKPYAEYKESGLPWLGQVPGHWSVEPHEVAVQCIGRNATPMATETNVLSLTLRGVVTDDPDNPEGLFAKDYRTYQFVAKGDLVLKLDRSSRSSAQVACGWCIADGIMSSAYVRYGARRTTNLRYFFTSLCDRLTHAASTTSLAHGIRHTLGSYGPSTIGIAIPPPAEQAAIVRFLDWANGRLERAIRAKRKVIALLNEQKQAIIHRAVTRGLDPSVPLKPSGIPWLGDIPQHWEVTKLEAPLPADHGRASWFNPHASTCHEAFPYLRSLDISSGTITTDEARAHQRRRPFGNRKSRLSEGDIVCSPNGAHGHCRRDPTGVGRSKLHRDAA